MEIQEEKKIQAWCLKSLQREKEIRLTPEEPRVSLSVLSASSLIFVLFLKSL